MGKNKRDGDVIYDNFDQHTGQPFNTKVLTHLPDGTVITDALVDNAIIFKNKPEHGGGYSVRSEYLEVGKLFLEKDTMQDMRDLSTTEILLLKWGYYKGVKLNGYYDKGDTPAPIEYFLSETTDEDDGGSVIEIGDIKLYHSFEGSKLSDIYFGYKLGTVFSVPENNLKLTRIYNSNASEVIHTKGYIANVDQTIVIASKGMYISGNSFTIRQEDQSGMIVSRDDLIQIQAPYVTVDGLIFDDNLDNNYIMAPDGVTKVHGVSGGVITGVPTTGHLIIRIQEDYVTVKNNIILGASWSAIQPHYKEGDTVRTTGVLIENNKIYNPYRDAIPIMHTTNVSCVNNEIINFSHHGIHIYRNTDNARVENNYIYIDRDEVYEWFTNYQPSDGELGGIIVDHISYSDKTRNTVVKGNTIESPDGLGSGAKYGIVTQGYPINVTIEDNIIINSVNGIYITRGNPTKLSVKGNVIQKSEKGIRFYPAVSGNVGGKDTPQISDMVITGNTIEAADISFEILGAVSLVQSYYSEYLLNITNNTLTGTPNYTFYNALNFNTGDTSGIWEIVYRNNTEINGSIVYSAQTSTNTYKGNSLVYVDTYYPVPVGNSYIVNHTSSIANSYSKIFEVDFTSSAQTISGTLSIIENRAVLNRVDIDLLLRGGGERRMLFRALSINDDSIAQQNFIPSNIVFHIDNTSGYKLTVYLRASSGGRNYVVDFKDLYPNEYVGGSLIINREATWIDELPTGPDISLEYPTLKSYSAVATIEEKGNIQLATQAEVNVGTNNTKAVTPLTLSGRTATTSRTGLVSQSTAEANISTADATDEATAIALVNELKAKINSILQGQRDSGQMST